MTAPERFRLLERAHKQFFAEYDKYLDGQENINWLGKPEVGELVRRTLYFHHGSRYQLLSYCIMPNHVHVVLTPKETDHTDSENVDSHTSSVLSDEFNELRGPLTAITHSLKSYTANRIQTLLKRTGQIWQHESYDHWIRDDGELERIVFYVRGNPVAANLVERPQDWLFCSCADRFQFDGDVTGWLSEECADACKAMYAT